MSTSPERWFDRSIQARRLSSAQAPKAPSIDYGYILYFMLHSVGFVASTMLMAFGMFVLFFLAIGGFSIDGMMHQLANMSGRYIEADLARVEGFKLVVGTAFMLFSAAIIFFRRHSLLPRNTSKGGRHHG